MKKTLSKTGVYAVILFAGLWSSILFILLEYPIEMAFYLTPFAERTIKSVLGYLGTIIVVFIAAYKEGYRSRSFNFKTSLIAAIIVFAIQQIAAPLIMYAIYVVGSGSVYLADAIYFKNQQTFFMNTPPDYITHICMTVSYLFVYMPLIFAGEKLGVRKHIKDVEKMKKQSMKGRI